MRLFIGLHTPHLPKSRVSADPCPVALFIYSLLPPVVPSGPLVIWFSHCRWLGGVCNISYCLSFIILPSITHSFLSGTLKDNIGITRYVNHLTLT